MLSHKLEAAAAVVFLVGGDRVEEGVLVVALPAEDVDLGATGAVLAARWSKAMLGTPEQPDFQNAFRRFSTSICNYVLGNMGKNVMVQVVLYCDNKMFIVMYFEPSKAIFLHLYLM